MMKTANLVRIFGVVSACALLFACDDPEGLVAVCVDPGESMPQGVWVCGEEEVVECATRKGTAVDKIHAQLSSGSCDETTLTVSDTGPFFALGTHEISVTATPDGGDGAVLCTSLLTVEDTTPPRVTPKTVELWPPNHKLHTITIGDCVDVVDTCDPDVEVSFTYAASDEPVNDTGDGNTDEDIVELGCGSVALRSERKGNGDARVYTLGFRAVDGSGNAAEGECHVIVPHDRGGKVPVDSGAQYRIEAPACE